MASPIPTIGIDIGKTGSRVLPIALSGVRGLEKGAAFLTVLEKRLAQLGDDDRVISQIAALLHAGTPIQTIIQRVVKEFNANARSTLERALASALAPPGASPPKTLPQAKELAATLETNLRKLLTTLSSATSPAAGQKNEIPGQLLDADSAKEPPAPQKKTAPQETAAAIAAFANDLLTRAAAPPAPAGAAHAAQLPASAPAPASAPPAAEPRALASADIVTRILTRAVNAQLTAPAASPPVHQPATPPSGNAAVFDRLIAIVSEHAASNQQGGTDGQLHQEQPQQQLEQLLVNGAAGTAPVTDQSPVVSTTPSGSVALPAFSAHLPLAAAPPPASNAHASYVPVDAQAVIDQIVKGILVSSSSDTSQIRLRLSPEHLGDVAMKLTVTGNSVSATVVAQNAGVRDVMLANQQQLSRALADAGLTLGTFSVDVSGGNASFAKQQSQRHAHAPKLGIHGILAGDDGEETLMDWRFGPPLSGGPRSLVLNYLA